MKLNWTRKPDVTLCIHGIWFWQLFGNTQISIKPFKNMAINGSVVASFQLNRNILKCSNDFWILFWHGNGCRDLRMPQFQTFVPCPLVFCRTQVSQLRIVIKGRKMCRNCLIWNSNLNESFGDDHFQQTEEKLNY